jgi:hypothetical protein
MEKQPFEGKIRVIEQLKTLIPPLSGDEFSMLEQSLVEEGRAYSALWLWGDVLVDGHHRLEICDKHNIPYQVVQVYQSAKTIEEVKYRMQRDSVGRRNLSPAVLAKCRAGMVAYHVNSGKGKQESVALVAKEAEVSERQVYRDVERSELIDRVDEDVRPLTESMSSAGVKRLAEMPKEKQKEAASKAGGDGRKLEGEIKKRKAEDLSPEESAQRIKNVANQHRDKLVLAIDDYARIKKNHSEQNRLVRLVQSVSLW